MVGLRGGKRDSGAPEFKTIVGAVLIVAVAGVLLLGGIYFNSKKSEAAALDPDTFCPRSGPVAVHSVLIDRTDRLSDLQLQALKQEVLHWAAQVPKHGAFRVYEVGVGGKLLTPVLDVCNPGDGRDASSLDANPGFLRKRYEQKFTAPINAMLVAMQADEEQATSPIMEAVQAISVHDFGDNSPPGENSLTIVSDLLQNGTGVSFYRNVPDAPSFEKSPTGKTLHADLGHVEIAVYLITRLKDAKYQTDALGAFWIHWLTDQGGDVGTFKHLPG